MKPLTDYGDFEISKIMATEFLANARLSKMDVEIYLLRNALDWYYEDIGLYVGTKYRKKPYTEGAIRYRIKKTVGKLNKLLADSGLH